MQYAHTLQANYTACPKCETELDQTFGVCPACRWDMAVAAQTEANEPEPDDGSFTERYRGTEYHHLMASLQEAEDGPGRTRLMLGVGLVGILGLFYFVADALYLI